MLNVLMNPSIPTNPASVLFAGEKYASVSPSNKKPKNVISRPNILVCLSDVGKSNVANRLKRVLTKFEGSPGFVRGVNGRSKFDSGRIVGELRLP